MNHKNKRLIGIDAGKINFKAVLLESDGKNIRISDKYFAAHKQEVEKHFQQLEKLWNIKKSDIVTATGKFRANIPFPSIVERPAQERAARFLYPDRDLTVIRLGGGGFSVLNIESTGISEYSRNPRCAAGAGSFLDQILRRVDLTMEQADRLAGAAEGTDITKRCGVTMKTDFTHLLNTGHSIEEVTAGILDATAKSALELALKKEIKPLLILIGGLAGLNRIKNAIERNLPENTKIVIPENHLYFEALGAALEGISGKTKKTGVEGKTDSSLKYLPPLSEALTRVRRMEPSLTNTDLPSETIAGLDIGSTGSKLVVIKGGRPVFESYTETSGQPIEAAKTLLKKIPAGLFRSVAALGLTGSGRDIVSGAIKASLPEKERDNIFVLNEIAAHAAGAHFYDNSVDTVVDIGGQDAKYVRLDSGRVIDSCMNTVCSAGTGSFLAEQLSCLGIENVEKFGEMALQAPRAVDLGQHCAVFISEQIDEVKRKGAAIDEIVAGLYYSIVLNYDNRVKGGREYGKKIFLQGKPATNIALAAALSAVTEREITVPPSPGTPGALGIAVLTAKELSGKFAGGVLPDFGQFLESRITERKTFRCTSTTGCTDGNLCTIHRIKVSLSGKEKIFFWGGACDKFESASGEKALAAKIPDVFAEREKLIRSYTDKGSGKAETVGIPRGLETEEILPFSAAFFRSLGFQVKIIEDWGMSLIEKGAGLCDSTFCAPLQIVAGQAKVQENENFIFLPKILEVSSRNNSNNEGRCYACPLSQAAPDMLSPRLTGCVVSPVLNLKNGLKKNLKEFLRLRKILKVSSSSIRSAFRAGLAAQQAFVRDCLETGRNALEFAEKNNLPAVVVLGHPYIVNSPLISSGIPDSIRQSGAVAIPASCYPFKSGLKGFNRIFWGYGRDLLQAAQDIRKTRGVYPLWLSVYSCGPDSFLIHFFQYICHGKPYAILESDAYTGQAGFNTRIEAFIYGIRNYVYPEKEDYTDFEDLCSTVTVSAAMNNGGKILIPNMGETSSTAAAVLNSIGANALALPPDTKEHLELGRRYTSGKECLPMIITLGGLLKFLENNEGSYYYMMPRADGPCRFGKYHLLFRIALEKAGFGQRVEIISPSSVSGYNQQINGPSMAKAWAATVFTDILRDALLDIRPEEKNEGSTQKIFDLYLSEIEKTANKNSCSWKGVRTLWGIEELSRKAAKSFKEILRDDSKMNKPTVLVTGEIFLRLNSFSNNNVIGELESLGVKIKLAPFREWINYVNWLRRQGLTLPKSNPFKIRAGTAVQEMIERKIYGIFADALDWPEDHPVVEILEEARDYLKDLKPLGEAALTIGLPLLLWKKKEIDAAVVVGPFECMPTRIGETQLNRIARQYRFPVLSLSYYGEAPDRDILEGFTHLL